MTNNRTYFPTAIDALLAIEQGFELVRIPGFSWRMIDVAYHIVGNDKVKYYPTPDTAHLLEPMVGDLVKLNFRDGNDIQINHVILQCLINTIYGIDFLESYSIIQRKGKPFPATATEEL